MIIYNLVIFLYGLVIRLASVKNNKAKLWIKGRQGWKDDLRKKLLPFKNSKKIWIHCASLGEFEQGRPLIEAIKIEHPQYKIILSFFSPSGYEIIKNYKESEVICYLPLDTKTNANTFLEIVKPNMAIFIKYEFWVNFLNTLKSLNIDAYLVSGVFKDHHPFFKWYGKLFVESLKAFKVLFVQDQHSYHLLYSIGVKNVQICGDTRFDRVLEIKNNFKPILEIEKFKNNSRLIVAGSTWPKDDELILESFKKMDRQNLKLLIAPHELSKRYINELEAKIISKNLKCCIYSKGINIGCDVLILDTMGLLSRVYHYGNLAYIGGGFGDGIHNILEPAVYQIPVAFYGKNYKKFNEAVDMVTNGIAFNILSKEQLLSHWNNILTNVVDLNAFKKEIDTYFKRNSNVTRKLLNTIDFV